VSREDTEEIFLTVIGVAILSEIVAALVILIQLLGERRADVVMFCAWFLFMGFCGWKGWKEMRR
jgi:hypothetical protein